ncbi:MAG: hypothetical protein KKC37_17065 [Proteobacteria bacterium]|nr:hypothetical protein [Pseudomonadota bacterium]
MNKANILMLSVCGLVVCLFVAYCLSPEARSAMGRIASQTETQPLEPNGITLTRVLPSRQDSGTVEGVPESDGDVPWTVPLWNGGI